MDFEKQTCLSSSDGILKSLSGVWNLTKAMDLSLNIYPKAYVELKVGGKSIAYLNWIYC